MTICLQPGPSSLSQANLDGLSSEQRLVLTYARQPFGWTEDSAGSVADVPSDWDAAMRLATREGLAPLVHSGLSADDPSVPSPVRAVLRTGYLAAGVRSDLWVVPTLRQVLPALARVGIDAIVLKGAALAHVAYPEPAHRTLSDIDLLVHPRDVARASKVLRELGYWTKANDPEPQHHLPIHYSADGHMGIELHHHVLKGPLPYGIEIDALWERSQIAIIAGTPARVLSAADALFLTCVHLSYVHLYRWYALRGLIDILAITTTHGTAVDWEGFVRNVILSHADGAVYWPLRLSQLWLGAPIPERVLSRIAPPPLVERVIAKVFESDRFLRSSAGGRGDVLNQLLVKFSLYGGCSFRDQLGVIFQSLFPPASAVGHLPPSVTQSRLRYAAYLGRPGRARRGLSSLLRVIWHAVRAPNA